MRGSLRVPESGGSLRRKSNLSPKPPKPPRTQTLRPLNPLNPLNPLGPKLYTPNPEP